MTKDKLRVAISMGLELRGIRDPVAVDSVATCLEMAFRLEQMQPEPEPESAVSPSQVWTPPLSLGPPPAMGAVVDPQGPMSAGLMAAPPPKRLVVLPGEATAERAKIQKPSTSEQKTRHAQWSPKDLERAIMDNLPERMKVQVQGLLAPLELHREQYHEAVSESWKVVYRNPALAYESYGGAVVQILSPEAAVVLHQSDGAIDFGALEAQLRTQAADVFRPRERVIRSETPERSGQTMEEAFAMGGGTRAVLESTQPGAIHNVE